MAGLDTPFRPMEPDFEMSTTASDSSHRYDAGIGCRTFINSFAPITVWLPTYSWKASVAHDIAGGVALGCILVAQSLAHANLCGVAFINGPYSCILPPMVYTVFGTCIHSSIGTGGLVSLLTGEQLFKLIEYDPKFNDVEHRTHAAGILTLLVGIMLALMGLFRLSFLVRFLSQPALSGFVTASAALIMLSQVMPMLGMEGSLEKVLVADPERLKDMNVPTFVLSSVSIAYLICAKQLKALPRPFNFLGEFKELVLLLVGGFFCYFFGHELGIKMVPKVPQGLPAFDVPIKTADDIALAKTLMPAAVLIGIVTYLSSFAGAKKFAMMDGYQISAINEFLALGFANIAGAFNGAVPTQIGLSRMGIAHELGVQSQLGSNVFVGLVVMLAIQALGPLLQTVPLCVLNAIIVHGASHLTEFDHLQWILAMEREQNRQMNTRSFLDSAVWWIAFMSTMAFGALDGMMLAVVVSLLVVLHLAANPPLVPLGYKPSTGKWVATSGGKSVLRFREGIFCFRVEGPLFFANIERLQEWLEQVEIDNQLRGTPLQAIVMSGLACPFVDTTALKVLKSMLEAYKARGVMFFIANAVGQPGRMFEFMLSKSNHLLPRRSVGHISTVQECIDMYDSMQQGSGPCLRSRSLFSLIVTPASEHDY